MRVVRTDEHAPGGEAIAYSGFQPDRMRMGLLPGHVSQLIDFVRELVTVREWDTGRSTVFS
jgi:hypothetical protein